MSRLEDLYLKMRKTPDQMSNEEAMELQGLARADRATVGQKTARAKKAIVSGKSVKKMTMAELEEQLAQLAMKQGNQEVMKNE